MAGSQVCTNLFYMINKKSHKFNVFPGVKKSRGCVGECVCASVKQNLIAAFWSPNSTMRGDPLRWWDIPLLQHKTSLFSFKNWCFLYQKRLSHKHFSWTLCSPSSTRAILLYQICEGMRRRLGSFPVDPAGRTIHCWNAFIVRTAGENGWIPVSC